MSLLLIAFHARQYDGALEAIARWKTRPNGITLSPNGRLLYVSDSDQRVIRMFDLGRNGEATNERVFVEKIPGIPGGLDRKSTRLNSSH